jgi:glucose dehydrogenase
MQRVGGVVSLTGLAVAIALATLFFDSPFGLAQGRLAGQSRQANTVRASAKPYTTWQSYAGGAHSSQYSALDQINKKNVAKLLVAWSYPIAGASIFNPVVVDGVMLRSGRCRALAAIDAESGKEIWRKEGMAPSGARGMNYWESPDRSDRRFIYLQRGDVIAVNAQNGEPIFLAVGPERKVHAYDRDNGRELWVHGLPNGAEGMPANYQVNGRQFVVLPVAQTNGTFPATFNDAESGRAAGPAPGGPPEAAAAPGAAATQGGQPGGGRQRRGGVPALPGVYIAFALP